MLQSISWQEYFTTLIVLLFAYYVVIGLLFFRNKLKLHTEDPVFQQPVEMSLFTSSDHSEFMPKEESHQNGLNLRNRDNDISASAESVVDELQAFTAAAGEQYSREELLPALKKLLKKYPLLRESKFQGFINNAIINECRNNCSIDLSETDLNAVWNG